MVISISDKEVMGFPIKEITKDGKIYWVANADIFAKVKGQIYYLPSLDFSNSSDEQILKDFLTIED